MNVVLQKVSQRYKMHTGHIVRKPVNPVLAWSVSGDAPAGQHNTMVLASRLATIQSVGDLPQSTCTDCFHSVGTEANWPGGYVTLQPKKQLTRIGLGI